MRKSIFRIPLLINVILFVFFNNPIQAKNSKEELTQTGMVLDEGCGQARFNTGAAAGAVGGYAAGEAAKAEKNAPKGGHGTNIRKSTQEKHEKADSRRQK